MEVNGPKNATFHIISKYFEPVRFFIKFLTTPLKDHQSASLITCGSGYRKYSYCSSTPYARLVADDT